MDSLDFYRNIVLDDLNNRDKADAMLTRVLLWVGKWTRPEDVYAQARLAMWAHENGYTTVTDTQEVAALLRRVEGVIPRDDTLFPAVHEMRWKYEH